MSCCTSRDRGDAIDQSGPAPISLHSDEGELNPAGRDAALALLDKLGDEERAAKLRDFGWILPATGHHFVVDDVTQPPGGARGRVEAHVRHWLPPQQVGLKAAIFFCHGMHAHINEKPLNAFLEALSAKGFAAFAFDLPGHGHSEGEARCLIPTFQACFDAHEAFIKAVMGGARDEKVDAALGVGAAVLARVRTLPFFLMGCSMGGMIAAFVAKQISGQPTGELAGGFRGAILLCPSLVVDLPPPPVVWFLRTFVVPSVPHQCMPDALSSSAATKPYDIFEAPAQQEMVILDSCPMPDYGWRGTAGGLSWRHGVRWSTANAFLEVFAVLEDSMSKMAFPFTILHDPKDKICFFEGSRNLMRLSPSKDKTLVTVRGGRHGLYANRPEEVLRELETWIGRRL